MKNELSRLLIPSQFHILESQNSLAVRDKFYWCLVYIVLVKG